MSQINTSDSITQLKCYLPNPTIAGNTVVIFLRYQTSAQTVTWTDNNGGNTYTRAVQCSDGTNSAVGEIWYTKPAAGTQTITVNLSSTHYVQMQPYEFYNVGTLDQAVCQASSGTSVQAPALNALSVSGDLVFHFGAVTNNTALNNWSFANQTNITWKPRSTMIGDNYGSAVQYGVYNSTSSFQPAMTASPSVNYLSAAAAFKPSIGTGAAPGSGVRVIYVQHDNDSSEQLVTDMMQYPIYGGAAMVLFTSGCSGVTSFSKIDCAYPVNGSDGTNVYTKLGSDIFSNSTLDGDSAGNAWFVPNVSAGTYLTTWTMHPRSYGGNGNTWYMLDVANAVTSSPVDTGFGSGGFGSATGYQDKTGGSGAVTSFTATPSNQNEVIAGIIGWAWDTPNGVSSPSGAVLLSCYYNTIANPSHCDLNSGLGTFYNASSTSSETWIWAHDTYNSPGVGPWIALGTGFVPSSLSQVATPTFSPPSGAAPQTVTVSTSTSGAGLCYTKNGTAPIGNSAGGCSNGTSLSNGGTVSVTVQTTLKAIGSKSGLADSTVGTASYTGSAGSWSVVQHKSYDHTCSSASTCALTGLTAFGSGHYAIIVFSTYLNNIPDTAYSSVTGGGGSWVQCLICFSELVSGVNTLENFYIYNLSPSAGTTSLTVNMTSNFTSMGAVVYELAWSGSAAEFDTGDGAFFACSGTNCSGVPIFLAGLSDVIVQSATPLNNSITGISGGAGYGNTDFQGSFGAGFAVALNTTNGATPTWTDSGSGDSVASSAIALRGIN
jgi:hypothetical protein